MSCHPVEALLRPPVELWSAVVALATAAIAVLAPWALMMPPGVAYAAAAALFAPSPDPTLIGGSPSAVKPTPERPSVQ